MCSKSSLEISKEVLTSPNGNSTIGTIEIRTFKYRLLFRLYLYFRVVYLRAHPDRRREMALVRELFHGIDVTIVFTAITDSLNSISCMLIVMRYIVIRRSYKSESLISLRHEAHV